MADDQSFIVSAMRQLENYVAINNVRCVQFRPKEPTDTYFITIANGAECSSPVRILSHIRYVLCSCHFLGWTKHWTSYITDTWLHHHWYHHARIVTYIRYDSLISHSIFTCVY